MTSDTNTKLILDNGASTVKIGIEQPKVCLNAVVKAKSVRTRVFVADQLEKDCKDLSSLYYLLGFQKGYITNWDIQKQVWDHLLGKDGLKVPCDDTTLVITEPYFNFPSIREGMQEIFFEEYGFQELCRTTPTVLSNRLYSHEQKEETGVTPLCSLVVDSGYSFTHIVPFCQSEPLMQAAVRINVGGKLLTNHLKEIISYRQLMVMDETYVMNQMKEDVCYVSQDFYSDMKTARLKGDANTIARDYVLPDYSHIKRGYVRNPAQRKTKDDSEQVIRMNNERFSVPEILFNPSDVGITEMGISEAINHVIKKTPIELQPHLYSNIVLTGGNACLPGFRDRVYNDVRSLADQWFNVKVTLPDEPATYAWSGGRLLVDQPALKQCVVTKQMYEDGGHNICSQIFKDF